MRVEKIVIQRRFPLLTPNKSVTNNNITDIKIPIWESLEKYL